MSNNKKKEKVIKTKVPEPKFIRFSELQRKYVTEMRNKAQGIINEALRVVYRELGILEKIDKAPPDMYQVRMKDCSGLDVFPPPPLPDPSPPEDPPVEDPKDIKPPEKETEPQK